MVPIKCIYIFEILWNLFVFRPIDGNAIDSRVRKPGNLLQKYLNIKEIRNYTPFFAVHIERAQMTRKDTGKLERAKLNVANEKPEGRKNVYIYSMLINDLNSLNLTPFTSHQHISEGGFRLWAMFLFPAFHFTECWNDGGREHISSFLRLDG